MNVEKIREKLKRFDKYVFEEGPHIYWWINKNGIRCQAQNSMTQLIHKHSNPFDAQKIAPFSARKLGISTQEVLDMWQRENKLSTTKGTYIHKYMEEKWLGNPDFMYPVQDVIDIFGHDILADKWDKLKSNADKFYEAFKDRIIPLGIELVVGDDDYWLCGSVDFLAYDIETDQLIIIDYKSNKAIKTENQYKQFMLGSLNHLPDINYIHYSLQLNGYQHIIEKNTGLKMNNTHLLIWINEKNDDFIIYTTKDLKKEAIGMIQNAVADMCDY